MSYAIPTKDFYIKSLPLEEIHKNVLEFINFACKNQNLNFNVTAIGCGLAGYKPYQIAPMFERVPANVQLPLEFIGVTK